MSKADFNKARDRLKKAVQEITWAIEVLDEPATHLQKYRLTPNETETLLQTFYQDIIAVQTALAQVLPKKVSITVASQDINIESVQTVEAPNDSLRQTPVHEFTITGTVEETIDARRIPVMHEEVMIIRDEVMGDSRAIEIPPGEGDTTE